MKANEVSSASETEATAANFLYTAADHAAACQALLHTAVDGVAMRDPEMIAVDDPALVGRVVARALLSNIPLPPFDNSQMDGYAVLSTDLTGASNDRPVSFPVGTTTAAGDAPIAHVPGTASPIMTGAAIPSGADAVIPIERAIPPVFSRLARAGESAPEATVAFSSPVPSGQFVRTAGSDLERGVEVLQTGERVTPTRVGALAAAGIAQVPVRSRARILVCSTGDEIVSAHSDAPLSPGQIRDANAPMLAAALRSVGAEVRVRRSGDRAEDFRSTLEAEWDWPDVVVTIGGISAGAFEVVRDALTPLGAEFVKVAMQPGGPQGLGSITLRSAGQTRTLPVLCFPGNPVSTLLSAELFLFPTLRTIAGRPARPAREQMLLSHDIESPVDKLQLRRGTIESDGRVSLSGPSSHLLSALASADVIAEIPLGTGTAAENTPVTVWRIND